MINKTTTRPLIRYHGGKWLLAPWIISYFPAHRIYCEAYGGGGSVLLRKKRVYCEVYNELDEEVTNLFLVCRDMGEELARVLSLTPFSRKEYEQAWYPSDDPIEQARRTVIRAYMGFGSAAVTLGRNVRKQNGNGIQHTGFRADSDKSGTTPAHDWKNYPSSLFQTIDRLKGVVIESREAMVVAKKHDSASTLHYWDPPYLPSTRDKGVDYVFEMTEADHIVMLDTAMQMLGFVVISGYDSDLYNDMLMGGGQKWRKVTKLTGARKECLWLSPNTTQPLSLF